MQKYMKQEDKVKNNKDRALNSLNYPLKGKYNRIPFTFPPFLCNTLTY